MPGNVFNIGSQNARVIQNGDGNVGKQENNQGAAAVFRGPVNFQGPAVVGDRGAAGGDNAVIAPIHAGRNVKGVGGIGNGPKR